MTTALDGFAGPGGWSLACRWLGITEDGIEIDPGARATREAAGFSTIHDDITTYEPEPGSHEGVIMSPPCQSFSAAGKRKGLEDPRGQLVFQVMRYAKAIQPRWIACEQVPAVLPIWQEFSSELEEMGYKTWAGYLHAEQYGVPQTRKRAILMAHRDRNVTPPQPTHSKYYPRSPEKLDETVKSWVSMAEALGWDGVLHTNRDQRPDGTRQTRSTEHPAPSLTGKSGGQWILRNNSSTNAAERGIEEPAPTIFYGARSNYVAWEWRGESPRPDLPEWCFKRPSTTIVGSFKPEIVAAPGYRTTVSRQNAPDSVRVSVEEAGILQSFPADFPWQGSRTKQFQQVGNAIPPMLAAAVLEVLLG